MNLCFLTQCCSRLKMRSRKMVSGYNPCSTKNWLTHQVWHQTTTNTIEDEFFALKWEPNCGKSSGDCPKLETCFGPTRICTCRLSVSCQQTISSSIMRLAFQLANAARPHTMQNRIIRAIIRVAILIEVTVNYVDLQSKFIMLRSGILL